jgi:hypothetical protein
MTASLSPPDNLATATQLEATIALTEWQRHRDLPPADRLTDYDTAAADAAFCAQLATMEAALNEQVAA